MMEYISSNLTDVSTDLLLDFLKGNFLHFGELGKGAKNIAKIVNAVQCHSLLLGHTDCHEVRFSVNCNQFIVLVITFCDL